MARHAKVVWVAVERPWELEARWIRTLSLPLNIMDNEAHPFCSKLREILKAARHGASKAPLSQRNALLSLATP